MLWYKVWLETRWRMLMPLSMILFAAWLAHSTGGSKPMNPHAANGFLGTVSATISFFWMMGAFILAGSGVATEAVFQAKKGIHGSMYFTLGLPVSRYRLFAVRVGVGLLETFALILFAYCIVTILLSVPGGHTDLADALRSVITLLLCAVGFYGLSTLLSTILDQLWQVWGSMIVFVFLGWLFERPGVPPSFNVFRVIAGAAAGMAHTPVGDMPWAAIAVSLCAGAAFLLAALRVVTTKEY